MISILIVEDDAFIRDITTIKFSEHAYETVACATAESALAALNARAFDCILLDLDLPDMSGQNLLTQIKAHPHGAEAKIIVFTNSDDAVVKAQVLEFGVLGLFAKAATPYEELFALIERTIPA